MNRSEDVANIDSTDEINAEASDKEADASSVELAGEGTDDGTGWATQPPGNKRNQRSARKRGGPQSSNKVQQQPGSKKGWGDK